MNLKSLGFGAAIATATAAATLIGSAPAQALILNGSFEQGTNPGSFSTLNAGSTDIANWTVTQGSIDYIGSYWQASDGVRSLDMNGFFAQGGIQQTFNTVIGQAYKVAFDIAGNPDGAPEQKVLSAITGGTTQTFTFGPLGTRANMGWEGRSFTFTADATQTILAFLGDPTVLPAGSPFAGNVTAFGPALDNVSVTAVPTPALLPAALGFGAAMLRKRKGEAAEAEETAEVKA